MNLLSPTQVAERTGLHPATIRRACERGELKGTKLGRQWRIPPHAYDEWLKQGEPEPGVREPRGTLRSTLEVVK